MITAFFRDSAIYAVPAFISRGLSLLLIPLYTRVLDPADYGSLDLLTMFASLVNLTVALEVSQGVARYYAGESDASRRVAYASSAFWFTLVCYTLFALLAFTYSHQLALWVMGRDFLVTEFRIGVVYIWLNGVFCLVQNQLRWELRSKRYAAVSLLVTLATAAMTVTLAYVLHWGLQGLLWGMVFGVLLGVVYATWHLRQSIQFRFDATLLKKMLLFSAPLVPSGVAVFISSYIDRLMINQLLSVDHVGLYGVGFRVASILGLAMLGFRGALTPLVYTHYKESDTPRQLASIFRFFLAFALILYLGLALFAQDIVVLISTPDYYDAAQVVTFLAPAVLLSQMYIFAPGIGIARKTYLILWINLCGAGLNTAFNWFLIPELGIRGAALATFLGYGFVFATYMVLSQRLYRVPHQWPRLIFVSALIGALVWLTSSLEQNFMHRWALNSVALCIGVASLLVSGLLRLSELRRLYALTAAKWCQREGQG